MVSTFSSPASNASDRDQLKAAAEKVMTQILLDPGYPYEWGSQNIPYQNLLSFGLAQYGQTSRQAYELDPDKVLRLNTTLQGSRSYYVLPSKASDLLALGNDYGFTLEFDQTLHTTATKVGTNKYLIKVTSEYSLPVIAANVSAILYGLDGKNIVLSSSNFNRTSYDGTCLLDFVGNYGSSRALIVAINYYGVQVTSILGAENAIKASLLGDNVILNSSVSISSDVREVIVVQGSRGTEFRNFTVGYTNPNPPNFLINPFPEPSAVGIVGVTDRGNLMIAQRDFSEISYRTIPAIRSASSSYSLDRTVLIGGSTFLVTLYLWRMSD